MGTPVSASPPLPRQLPCPLSISVILPHPCSSHFLHAILIWFTGFSLYSHILQWSKTFSVHSFLLMATASQPLISSQSSHNLFFSIVPWHLCLLKSKSEATVETECGGGGSSPTFACYKTAMNDSFNILSSSSSRLQ